MPIVLFPRPSILTSIVVATSITSGLAFGVLAAGVLLAVHRFGRN